MNNKCNPAERVVLPRLLDVVTDSFWLLKTEGAVTFAAVDIKDAFHNVLYQPAQTASTRWLPQNWRTRSSSS